MSKRRRSFNGTGTGTKPGMPRPSPHPTRARSYRERATILQEYPFRCPCCQSRSIAIIGHSTRAPVVCEVRRSCSCRISWPDMVDTVHTSLRSSQVKTRSGASGRDSSQGGHHAGATH